MFELSNYIGLIGFLLIGLILFLPEDDSTGGTHV